MRALPGASALIWLLLAAFLSAQLIFAHAVKPLRPAIEEMPYPLGGMALKALAFGDDQFVFRAVARWLQDVGDGGGRMRPLRDYDYDRVVGWLRRLDSLDDRSDYAHVLAARYFGALVEPKAGPPRVKKIAEYLRQVALGDPAHRWSWLVWAAIAEQHMVKDRALGLTLANDAASLRGNAAVPAWLPLIAIPLYRLAGDEAAARALEADPALAEVRRQALAELAHQGSDGDSGRVPPAQP